MKSIKKVSALTVALIFAATSFSTAAFADDLPVIITLENPVGPCFDTVAPATFSTLYNGDPIANTPGSTLSTSVSISTFYGRDENCGDVIPTGYSISESGWVDSSLNPASGITTKVGCAMDVTEVLGIGKSCTENIFGISLDIVTDGAVPAGQYSNTVTITLVP